MVSAAGFNVAIHIGEQFKVDKDAGMRRFLLPAMIGCAALIVGVVVGSINQHLLHKRQSANIAQAVPTNLPAQPAEGATIPPSDSYPEDKGLTPWEIEYFIDQHPNANLTPLFARLKSRWPGVYPSDSSSVWQCNHCKAQTFEYNLDNDAHSEVVLRITDRMIESSEYLVFKERAYDDAELLGQFDAWGKYRPSTHAVLLSGGRQWLVVESQAATGSGLSAYLHTIYQVTPKGVKPAVSYLSEINQSGYYNFPAKRIVAQPVSCKLEAGRMKTTVSYTVQYFHEFEKSLFTKQQTAVLTATVGRHSTRLVPAASNITNHEFETVFNFDSMGDDEFLNYNGSELRAIALGSDATKKKWLKEYLENCESSSSVKRELLSLLR